MFYFVEKYEKGMEKYLKLVTFLNDMCVFDI